MKRARRVPFFPHALTLGSLLGCLLLSPLVQAEKLSPQRLSSELRDTGLVVMQVAPQKWERAHYELSDGRKGEYLGGFFVEELEPGTYELDTITRLVDFDYGGAIATGTYATLPVEREFVVEAGKVTHLGLLYLLEDPGPAEGLERREYLQIAFEHPGSEQSFLQEFYPELASTLSPDDVVSAPYDYVNDSITRVRQIMLSLYIESAVRNFQRGNEFLGYRVQTPIELTESGYVVGDLGLVARMGSDGKVRLLPNDSLDRVRPLAFSRDDPWFYTPSGTLLTAADGRLRVASPGSTGFSARAAALLGPGRIVMSDRRFNLRVSLDGGQSWQQSREHSVGDRQSLDVEFSQGADRVYVIGRDHALFFRKPAVAVIDRTTGRIDGFDVPRKIRKGLKEVFETDAGLYVQVESGGNRPTTLYLQRRGSEKWEKSEVMSYFGCRISFPDRSGREISARCGPQQEVLLFSSDFGRSWQRATASAAR